MGTPEFSVPVLSELIAAGHEIAAVYTQPPRPAGRGKKLRPSPIQTLAEQYSLPIRTPENFKAAIDREEFEELDLDVAIVVAYGLILPRAILDAPKFGCLNLHASLLPRWRGAAPIHRSIMAGDRETGVQVMQMETGLDTGPILLSEAVEISSEDTTSTLHDRLSSIGAQLVPRALAALERDSLVPSFQDEEGVTYAHKINTDQAAIDWKKPACEVDWHIRGLSQFPGAWCIIEDRDNAPVRVKVLFSELMGHHAYKPSQAGSVVQADDALVIACGEGHVRLMRLQRPGKAPQDAADFLRGMPVHASTILKSTVHTG